MKKVINFIKEDKWFIITLLAIVLLFNIHLPFYISTSGGTIDISNRIDYYKDTKINGSLNMLYVTEYEATIPTYLLSYIFKNWQVEEISNSQISDETTEEIYERNKIMLDNSIQNAIFVAYNAAAKDIKITGYDNLVIGTTRDTNIKIGDKITNVNGIEVKNINDIKEIINNSNIGDSLDMTVIRNNKEKKISTTIYESNSSKMVGIAMITNYQYELDPDISIKFKESESGSSGGLMMALCIYSTISDEDIVKGRNIAGTGTIDIEGNVGEIDGIKYKLIGAVKKNMDIVLVPKANYKEAIKEKEKNNYDIEIISIETFDDAINYLKNTD